MTDSNHDSTPTVLNPSRRDVLAAAVGLAALGESASIIAQPVPELPTSSRELWQWVRTQPVMEPQTAYLDTASVGPTLRAAMAAEYRSREIQSFSIATSQENTRWSEEAKRLAGRYAQFAGCDPDELTFTRGAGEGLSMVAGGLDFLPGDEVIMTSREHPAAAAPWLIQARRRGIIVKQVDLPQPLTGPEQVLGLIAGAVTERTRIIALPHLQYGDGAVLPVKEVCQFARQRNILTVIDGAQALGMLDFDLRELECDFYATCFHKWALGCHGSGMLYIRREVLERLWPTQPRALENATPGAVPAPARGQADLPAAMQRLGNVIPYLWPALRGSEAALELHQRIGRARIEARIRELAIYLRLRVQQLAGVELLTPARPGMWAGVFTFRVPGRVAAQMVPDLGRVRRVHVRPIELGTQPEGAFRVSLHMFNSHDDIEKLIAGFV